MPSQEKSKLKKQIGSSGEVRAREYFVQNGYKIVAQNFRSKTGEIDLIAARENSIIFIEVKTLLSRDPELLARELNSKKQKRIIETAKYFLAINREYSNSLVRFDVVVIDMPGYPPVYHIENAFAEFS
ncbi:MAG: YraN family protein [Treponema sp.]|nr:YraN family protein [Candidatus Treponema scatequi]